jgi:plastocyanin
MRLLTSIAAIATAGSLLVSTGCSQPRVEAGPPAPGQPLASTATDNIFSPTAYTITASETYTLTMSNAGQAIHNWHIIDAKNENGKDIATDLTSPHKASSVTFTIARPGVYHFQCDVHPDTMKGTLTVSAT